MRKNVVYANFLDYEKTYDRINREALWLVLKVNDVGVNCWMELRVCILII